MNRFDEFDQYSENMLMAQYDVSDIINHELMKGEVREDFLIATLQSCSEPQPAFVRGTLSDGERDAGQLDIVLCRPHAHPRRIGSQCFIEKSDSLCVIEVKGNATGRDLDRAEKKAKTIQKLKGDHTPLYGVVCYKVALDEKTIMKRFGFTFDREKNIYVDNATIPNEKKRDWQEVAYPNLDFFVSLEDGKKVFLRKYEFQPGRHRFIRSGSAPLIKDLFTMMRSLWVPANEAVHA